jgi:transposase
MYKYEKTIKTKYGEYTYIFLAHSKRVNGKSKRVWEVNLGRKDEIEENLPFISRKLSNKLPESREYHFGLVNALHSICEELELEKVINACVDKREQGISVGECIVVLAINRAVALNSKSKVQEWFTKTTLSNHYPHIAELLTPQNIWNQMGYLDQATIRQIEDHACKLLFSRGFIHSGCFLFDPTNFYTYIREHEKNIIAQRGNNKKKRNELRQVNMSLLVTRDDFNIPVMHETYAGNIADPTHFREVLKLMVNRFTSMGVDLPDITVVFDKGNNSDDAYAFMKKNEIFFISSVRPSMIGVKSLIDVPLSDFEVLWTKERKDSDVLGYRVTTDLYHEKGTQNTLVVTYDEDTRALQKHCLQKKIDAALLGLEEFITTKLNSTNHWRSIDKIKTKINRDFLNTKQLKSIVDVSITLEGDGLDVEWDINEGAMEEECKVFGKSFIFSNRNDWSTRDIVKTYRDQRGVEDQFKEFNKRDCISIMPMYHWTNQKIRAHFYISNLALLITNILHQKLRKAGVSRSKEECMKSLDDIKEIHLHHDDGYPPDVIYTKKSKFQKHLCDLLDLGRFERQGFGVVKK